MKKVRIGLYVPENVDKELQRYEEMYGVSKQYVLLLGFKLTDRQGLERVLKMRKGADG